MRLPFLGLDATAWVAFAFAGNAACFAGRGILLMVMPQPMPPPVRACGALPHPLLLSVPVLPHIAVTWVNVIAIGIGRWKACRLRSPPSIGHFAQDFTADGLVQHHVSLYRPLLLSAVICL
jgi:hypothetical protein